MNELEIALVVVALVAAVLGVVLFAAYQLNKAARKSKWPSGS
jgi:hypothetical protein